MRKAIGFYVKHPLYLNCLIDGTVPYDLQGQESVIVDQSHKDNAQEI